jgi:hypothetical protein
MEEHLPIKSDLTHGDWVKLSGQGWAIYGKVTVCSDSGQVKIVTSTLINNPKDLKPSGGELQIVKIAATEVPKKAKMWILARISRTDEPVISPTPAHLLKGDWKHPPDR